MNYRFFVPFKTKKRYIYLFDALMLFIAFFRYTYKWQTPELHNWYWSLFFYGGFLLLGLLANLIITMIVWDLISLRCKKENVPANEQRRSFLKLGLFSGVGVGTTLVGLKQSEDIEIQRVEIKHPKFNKKNEELTICQLSDLHIGPTLGVEYLNKCVELIMSTNPDIIAITGDLIDGRVDFLRDQLAPLKKLKAKYGVFFVTGNHEFYWKADEWIKFIQEELNIEVLQNSGKYLDTPNEKIWICGVSDYGANRFNKSHYSDPLKALTCQQDVFKILLAHQPRSAFKARENGCHLQLSGHTHGGQSFPFNLLIALTQPYFKGLYKERDFFIYVSTGAGYWGPPIRLGIPPRVDLLTIKST
ncbi:hypothetical protein A9Q84_12175 [Halobacteriovorax marinus]|uniref:Calcineurin-like phosphoesterase domain-containing protein n=1 Tax=Halobacteriovorax marinus TaxID=97084 RepID=A0A1Y5FCA3_9BACT|nr:hypothetical protein A9Q84_12175 [Halobacteriovorax marinus]